MACVSMAMPLTSASQKGSEAFLNPLPLRPSSSKRSAVFVSSKSRARVEVKASFKEKVITGVTAAAMTASVVMPEVAEAAVSPSLKNFLLSIAAGGIVLTALVGAVIGVANFDPVKRT